MLPDAEGRRVMRGGRGKVSEEIVMSVSFGPAANCTFSGRLGRAGRIGG